MINAVLSTTTKFLTGTQVYALDDLPGGQYVFFANHQSHLDALVIYAALPAHLRTLTRPVSGKEYWNQNVFRRQLSHAFNALLIDRTKDYPFDHPQHPINLMLWCLDHGHSLLIFPEGTRSQEGNIQPFKSGLYHLARQRPSIPLVPIYIENLSRILPKGEILPVPLIGRVIMGRPLSINPDEAKDRFLERARETMCALSGRRSSCVRQR